MVVAPEGDFDDTARLWHATERGIEGAMTNWLVLEIQPWMEVLVTWSLTARALASGAIATRLAPKLVVITC